MQLKHTSSSWPCYHANLLEVVHDYIGMVTMSKRTVRPTPCLPGTLAGPEPSFTWPGLTRLPSSKSGVAQFLSKVHVLPISTLISATSHTRLQYLVAYTMCTFYKFRVCKSVHQINQPTRCISHSDLLLVAQIQLNMFRASSCPSSGAYEL